MKSVAIWVFEQLLICLLKMLVVEMHFAICIVSIEILSLVDAQDFDGLKLDCVNNRSAKRSMAGNIIPTVGDTRDDEITSGISFMYMVR